MKMAPDAGPLRELSMKIWIQRIEVLNRFQLFFEHLLAAERGVIAAQGD